MEKKKNNKIVVGMSGGVDSSMTLVILKELGWDPVGVSLKLPSWEKDSVCNENACCTEDSLKTASDVCNRLGVMHHIYDVREDFKKEVIRYFLEELKENRTPNPCVICNRYLKFRKLFEWAHDNGIEDVATGHYARKRIDVKTGLYELIEAKDISKDQSYGLSFLTQGMLEHIHLPLGDMMKEEVYALAKEKGFRTFLKKKQSQDVCFVSRKSFNDFIRESLGESPGVIVDSKGNKIGKHKGLHFYTLGQKKGLNLSSTYYVKSLDKENNSIIVTKKRESISSDTLILYPVNFISGHIPKSGKKVMARTRYHQEASPARLYPLDEGKKIKIVFDHPKTSVAPGQFCVFYEKDSCLGAGVIKENHF